MNQPSTIYEVLAMLADYHQGRAKQYGQIGAGVTDPQAEILLEHLVELEEHSFKVIQAEMNDLHSDHSTFLIPGPVLSDEALHAVECRCGADPSLAETIDCAFASGDRLNELITRIESSSAAPSVAALASRLHDLELIKSQQIAKFTRED